MQLPTLTAHRKVANPCHQGFHLRASVLAFLLGIAACTSQPPTAPLGPGSPPGTSPPPTDNIDWEAMTRLFDDPLFRLLPFQLANQEAARPLQFVVEGLVGGIAIRDIDVEAQLARIMRERQAYARLPDLAPGDAMILGSIALFEMRGRAFLDSDLGDAASPTPDGSR